MCIINTHKNKGKQQQQRHARTRRKGEAGLEGGEGRRTGECDGARCVGSVRFGSVLLLHSGVACRARPVLELCVCVCVCLYVCESRVAIIFHAWLSERANAACVRVRVSTTAHHSTTACCRSARYGDGTVSRLDAACHMAPVCVTCKTIFFRMK